MEEKLKMLQEVYNDTLQYYMEDPNRRAAEGTTGKYSCKYRTEDGRMCAVGRYIPEENYSSDIEENAIDDYIVQDALPEDMQYDEMIGLLCQLQTFHDSVLIHGKEAVKDWQVLAIKYMHEQHNIELDPFEL